MFLARSVVARSAGGAAAQPARFGTGREIDQRRGHRVRQFAIELAGRLELHRLAADEDITADVVVIRVHVDDRVDAVRIFFDGGLS